MPTNESIAEVPQVPGVRDLSGEKSRGGGGRASGRDQVAQRPGAARALGLVAYKTSEERQCVLIGEIRPYIVQAKLPPDGQQWRSVVREEARARRCKRSIITRARCMVESVRRGGFRVYTALLTLTYRDVDGWAPRHVSDALEAMRTWMKGRGHALRYVWVAELQERGAVHYHVLIWLPRGVRLPKPDNRGWWSHGSSRIEGARNSVGYLAKYASKCLTVEKFPRGLRLSGFGGLDEQARQEATWWMLPSYVRERFTVADLVRRAPGGGFVASSTGEWIGSTWGLWDKARDWSWIVFAEVPDE